MDQTALDMLVRYMGYFFLGGFTVGLIVRMLLGKSE
jgi:hypothetical protein